jgi:AraC family ethanolamine operon transcriptional activator
MSSRARARKRTADDPSPRIPDAERRAGRPRVSRAEAIARITRFLAASESRTVHMASLSRASGVSERTLRAIFTEIFGMSPMRYLRTRKLHAIRAELAVADPSIETVAAVARRLGVKDSGRMASDYYAIFGEYPRKTLERQVPSRGSRS